MIKTVREQRKNADGSYDIVHPETQAKVVWFEDGESLKEKYENGEFGGFSGDYNDLKNIPSSFEPASHDQAASTISAGTFAGQVVANSSGQAVGTSLLRNSKIVSSDTNPTANGEINWTYG